MKFKIGQEVTPTKKIFNCVFGSMVPEDFPQFGKIYTVSGYPLEGDTKIPLDYWGMMSLEEKQPKNLYHERHFAAVLPAEAIEEALEKTIY